MTTTSSIKKWGNSLALRIPARVAQDLDLSENSTVQISSDGMVAIIQPNRTKKKSLKELVDASNPDNRHEAVDWGNPLGKEIW